MKKVLKSSLSLFLAVTIIFSSAYVGLAEIDFSEIKFDNPFAVKSKATSVIYDGTCGDNSKWTIDNTGTLTIFGTGEITEHTWDDFKKSIKRVVIDTGITSVGKKLFEDYDELTSVTISDSVTRIGDYAFMDCSKLTSITISDGLKSIGDYAFYDCFRIDAVHISDIAKWCEISFNGCYSNPLYYAGNLYLNGELVTDLVIPDGVTSISSYAFSSCGSLTTIAIPDSIESIGSDAFYNTGFYNDDSNWEGDVLYIDSYLIEAKTTLADNYEIKSGTRFIADSAFSDCKELTSVTMPESVTSIGDLAFNYCLRLTSINLPEGVVSIGDFAFNYCLRLASINIPEGVVSIGDDAFYNCRKLASINIPEGVVSIGDYAFYNCTSLELIEWNAKCVDDFPSKSSILEYEDNPEKKVKIVFGNNVEKIPAYMCYGLTNIHEVEFGDNLKSIGESAFYGTTDLRCVDISNVKTWCNVDFADRYSHPCSSSSYVNLYVNGEYVDEIIIPDGIKKIKYRTFYNFVNLSSITIPDSVTSIGDYAFASCDDLTSVTMPDSITSIGEYTFYYCENLTTVTIPSSIKSIGEWAFSYCESLTSITIPDSVTSIDECTFFCCESLTSITIPDSVTSIGVAAFKGCSNLTSITIPDSVTSIARGSFSYCECLTSITIPDGITSIGAEAFGECKNLSSIVIGKGLKEIGKGAFSGCNNLNSVFITDLVGWCNIKFDCVDSYEENYNLTANPLHGAKEFYINGKLITDIVIPIGVTDISDFTFAGYKGVVSVTLPDGLKRIGEGAFKNCTNLNSIIVGDELTSIGKDAFSGTAYYDDLLYREYGGILYLNNYLLSAGMYEVFNIGSDYKIKDGTKLIADYAFCGSKDLVSVTIPDSVTHIGKGAFKNCSSLKTISITDNVISIGMGAFGGTKYVNGLIQGYHSIIYIGNHVVDSSNPYYQSSFTIKEGTKTIADSSFANQHYISKVTIPDTVTNIGNYAFFDTRISSVTIPKSVVSIGEKAFGYPIPEDENASDFSIVGYENTVAETYAKEHGFTFVKICEHKTKKWITDKKATCTSSGFKHKECTECGEIFETAEIPQLKCSKPVLKKVYNANSYVKVTWGTVEGADLYRVYRKTGTGEYEYIGSTARTYFNDKEAGAGKTCRYIVKAKNEAGYSDASASIAIKHIDEPTLKSIENSAYGVLVKWDKVTGAEKYNVYRKVSGGEYEYIGATTNTYYTDKTAESGTKYYYAIRGKRDDSVSSQSASLSKYYLADPTLKSIENSAYGVLIKWDNVTGAEKYSVYRKVSGGEYEYIGATSDTYYTDKIAESGTKYYYEVRAKKGETVSALSSVKSIYHLADTTLNTPSSTQSGIKLSWSKVTGAEGYMVYRKTADGDWKRIATVEGVSKLSYTDSSAKKGKKYTYKIKAYKSKTYSAYSNTKTITDKY